MQLQMTDLEVTVSLGVYAWEKRRKRKAFISLTVDYAPPLQSDALAETLDYDALARRLREVAESQHYNLVETMLRALGKAVLEFPHISAAAIAVSKPGAVPGVRGLILKETFSA